jgi:hypothetical protein
MPVSTVAYEILLEFTNDTLDALRLTGPSGSSVLVERGQGVLLVPILFWEDKTTFNPFNQGAERRINISVYVEAAIAAQKGTIIVRSALVITARINIWSAKSTNMG